MADVQWYLCRIAAARRDVADNGRSANQLVLQSRNEASIKVKASETE